MKTTVAAALQAHRHRLLQLPNVVGAGVGLKEQRGRILLAESPALVVLVERKVPRDALKSREVVPARLGGVSTDVISVGRLRLISARTDRLRPAQPGSSIGHVAITAGTFGALVRDGTTGEPLILSNNHVLANTTDGADGRAAVGDAIVQPGPYDGGTDRDIIATLARFVPIWRESMLPDCRVAAAATATTNTLLRWVRPNYRVHLERLTGRTNLVDAALARPVDPDLVAEDVLEVGAVRGTAPAELGMGVMKSGRTTGITTGTVRVTGATVRVGLGDGAFAVFEDQIITSPMAQPGDSGSLLLTEDHRAVGLLAAGSDQSTVHGRVEHVQELLGVDVAPRPEA